MTFSGQGLQSNEGGFLFKPLGFCNLPELVPLSQQSWSRNLREELRGCESSAAEGLWEVHRTVEVWFAHPDPNHHCQSAPFVAASPSPLFSVPNSALGAGMPLLQSSLSW